MANGTYKVPSTVSTQLAGTGEQVLWHDSTGPAAVSGPVTCTMATGAATPSGPPVKVLMGQDGTLVISPGESGANTAEGTWHTGSAPRSRRGPVQDRVRGAAQCRRPLRCRTSNGRASDGGEGRQLTVSDDGVGVDRARGEARHPGLSAMAGAGRGHRSRVCHRQHAR
jgi:hypothetical protein